MAITADRTMKMQSPGKLVSYPAVASVAHYAGALVYLVAASGYATNAIAAGANAFAGIVKSGGGIAAPTNSGDANVECWTEGDFVLPTTGASQAWVGDLIYGIDNGSVDATSTNQTLVGRCVGYISATSIVVRIQVNAT